MRNRRGKRQPEPDLGLPEVNTYIVRTYRDGLAIILTERSGGIEISRTYHLATQKEVAQLSALSMFLSIALFLVACSVCFIAWKG